MIYFYIVASAVLIPVLNGFLPILKQPYSFWLVPALFVGFLLCFIIIHAVVFFLSIQLVNLNKNGDRFSRYYRGLIKISLPLAFTLARVHIHSTGTEKIPENTRVLLVCNHIDIADPVVILNELPDLELSFIAKKEIYTQMPFPAKAMHKLGCIPIDRENSREGVKAILKAVDVIKADKASVAVFPEGYTSKDGRLQPFRNGAFKIATKAGVPIVVCTPKNSDKIIKNLFKRRTDVYFEVTQVIPADEVTALHTDAIGERVFKSMQSSLEGDPNNV